MAHSLVSFSACIHWMCVSVSGIMNDMLIKLFVPEIQNENGPI